MGGLATPPTGENALLSEEPPTADSRTAAYGIVRQAGPVAPDDHGAHVITTGAGAEHAHRNPGLFPSKRAFDGVGGPAPMVPIGADAPGHTRYRRLLRPMSGPRSTAPRRPAIRALAGELIGRVETRAALEERHRRIPGHQPAPGSTPRASWPADLVGAGSPPLVFTPGGEGGR